MSLSQALKFSSSPHLVSKEPSALESSSLDDLSASSGSRSSQKSKRSLSLSHRGLVVDTSHVSSLGGAGKGREEGQGSGGALGKGRGHAGRSGDTRGHRVGLDHGGGSLFDGGQRVDVSSESGNVSGHQRGSLCHLGGVGCSSDDSEHLWAEQLLCVGAVAETSLNRGAIVSHIFTSHTGEKGPNGEP